MHENFRVGQRALISTAVVVSVFVTLAFAWYAMDLLMLLFLGVLISIPLRRLSEWLGQRGGMGHGAALAIVVVALATLFGLIAWLVAERIVEQATVFTSQVQMAFETVRAKLESYAWFRTINSELPDFSEIMNGGGGMVSRITGVASSALGAVVSSVLVVIVAIYLASQPGFYSSGVKRLLPFKYRKRGDDVFNVIDEALGRWVIGRLALMVINGVLTAVALWAIGVPLAGTLGVVAGLLNFIPNFGPFIAAIPALLIAFVQSPMLALYTGIVYIIVQMIDGYVLTPLVDRKSVELPPVVTIAAQVLLGILSGFVGLLVASPLTATVMILIKMLYIEDVLGDPIMEESAVIGDSDKAA
jgi:predicted PurR-regulated permease PerM